MKVLNIKAESVIHDVASKLKLSFLCVLKFVKEMFRML